jgi:hypothetical protein
MSGYWIKSAGTAEGPLPADWYRGGASWREKHGDAAMFSRRPRVEPGDRFVYYAVGSAAQFKTGRIFSVVECLSEPEPSGHQRWPWQVMTRMLVPGPRLPSCPSIDDVDVEQTSLRRQSHISISDEQGRTAERLIARAADRTGSLGACYKGPPPPPGFKPGQ